ncbi:hypothetical protein [Spiroplasma endosymbiont of Dilophus febrilis]|uniref:hypothetical protein n=1 Tax=Spiroplasma endosymbiont of Dilophus febrilis TaxID=3066292 RepID=UPI00313C8CB4
MNKLMVKSLAVFLILTWNNCLIISNQIISYVNTENGLKNRNQAYLKLTESLRNHSWNRLRMYFIRSEQHREYLLELEEKLLFQNPSLQSILEFNTLISTNKYVQDFNELSNFFSKKEYFKDQAKFFYLKDFITVNYEEMVKNIPEGKMKTTVQENIINFYNIFLQKIPIQDIARLVFSVFVDSLNTKDIEYGTRGLTGFFLAGFMCISLANNWWELDETSLRISWNAATSYGQVIIHEFAHTLDYYISLPKQQRTILNLFDPIEQFNLQLKKSFQINCDTISFEATNSNPKKNHNNLTPKYIDDLINLQNDDDLSLDDDRFNIVLKPSDNKLSDIFMNYIYKKIKDVPVSNRSLNDYEINEILLPLLILPSNYARYEAYKSVLEGSTFISAEFFAEAIAMWIAGDPSERNIMWQWTHEFMTKEFVKYI